VEPGGLARTYGVMVYVREAPSISKPSLLGALRKLCPRAEPLDGNEKLGSLYFVHPDHPIQLKDARIAAQTFIVVNDHPPDAKKLEESLQQSWTFSEARDAVARCHGSVFVSDIMSSGLPYQERLDLFHRGLLSVLEIVSAEAIHWIPSGHVVRPSSVVAAAADSAKSALFFAGAINVRMFNLSGTDGEVVMDTLGLAALGLPDLQCHFHGLEPGAVAPVLYNTGFYLFENGDVIEDGHTVEGAIAGSRWRCQHEDSLVAPARVVVDMNPGLRYAAGDRGGAA
jgi:hypothetical protein